MNRQLSTLMVLLSCFFLAPIEEAKAEPPRVINKEILDEVQRFSDSIYLIKNNYVYSVKDNDLFNQAISGMVSGLDPDSQLVNTKDILNTKDNEGDIGLILTLEDGIVRVITPIVDRPAFKAGVKPDDYIIKLNGQSTQGLSLDEANQLLRGKESSNLSMVILRKGLQKPLVLNIARDKSEPNSVTSRLLEKHFAYLRLAYFAEDTDKKLLEQLKNLKAQSGSPLQGLVLDLRYNPGGSLESAVAVADSFLEPSAKEKKLILKVQGRTSALNSKIYATKGDILDKAPLVILINHGSMGEAEIVAGALKDNHRAIVIGSKSYGRAALQSLLPLDNGYAIKLTTAYYYTASDLPIQNKGISPDIAIEDLQIPKLNAENKNLKLSEANLKSHLLGQGEAQAIELKLDDNDLIHEDYQLYTALTLLKSTAINRLSQR